VQHNAVDSTVPSSFKVSTDKIEDRSQPFIMVVEDDPDMLNYLVMNLGERYNIYASANTIEALEKLETVAHLDLVISDVMMGEIDGFEFRKKLTESDMYAHIPFIFLTAKTTAEDKLNGFRLGAIDYIEKPFFIDQLILKIEAVLKNLKEQRAAVIHHAYNSILENRRSAAASTDAIDYATLLGKIELTKRETQVTELMIRGLPYKEIADALNISDKTVARHVSKILEKFSVNSRVELINKLRPIKPPFVVSRSKDSDDLGGNTHKNG
jgi:DNA-binding NarL/FixJ family response regulator